MRRTKKRYLNRNLNRNTRRALLRASLFKELYKYAKPQTAIDIIQLGTLVNKVANSVANYPDFSHKKLKESIYSDIFGPALSEATFLAGLASAWEFELRLLANKLGIKVTQDVEETTAKGKKLKYIEFRDLDLVITELDNITNRNLNLQLPLLRQLRNSVIHFNYNQTRRIFNYSRKEIPEEHKSMMWELNLGSSKIERPGDISSLEDMISKNIYTWFMDFWGTPLPEKVRDLFVESCGKIHFLSYFHAICFEDRSSCTISVFLEGKKLSNSELESFDVYLKEKHVSHSLKEFQKMLKSCFIKLS